MRNIIFTLLFIIFCMAGFAQVANDGGVITVDPGATLVIQGNYTSTNSGTIQIDGTVELQGNLVNTSGSIASASTGLLKFNGSSAQQISGAQSLTFYCDVEVDNSNGVSITGADQVLNAGLTLTAGSVTLNAYDLTMSAQGVTGADASNHIVTNSTGELKSVVAASDVTFPVGNSTYNPVTLNNAGTSDTYGVRIDENLPSNWTPADHAVARTWVISEAVATGSDLTVTPQWGSGEEQTSFDNSDCAVGLTIDDGSSFTWAASSAASGTDPYTQTGSNFGDAGKYVVGDFFHEGLDVDLDLFLAGPYLGGTMTTNLNTKTLIPFTDPYSLGTTVASIPANAVDWIKVELRDKTNSSTILHSQAFFLDNTGNVISPDGSASAKFTSVAKDQYYIAVKHRNHLGAMTNATVDLTAASPAFNFKSGTGIFQNQSYFPMFNLGGGNYGLYKGNVNGDTRIAKVGVPSFNDYSALLSYLGVNTAVFNVYAGADVNLDGDVRKVGVPGVNDYSQILNSLGTNTSIFQQIP